MNKNPIPLINNAYIISLIGEPQEIANASSQIQSIVKSWGLTCELVSIKPECLATCVTNEPSEWRVQLKELLVKSNAHIIINSAGWVNSDAITDWSRSVCAFSTYSFINRHPWNFIVDPTVTNREKENSLLFKSYESSGHVNIYACADTLVNNKAQLEVYIKPKSSY